MRALLLIYAAASLLAVSPSAQTAAPPDQAIHEGHHGHDGHAMPMSDEPMDPAKHAAMLAGQKESEFNHHLAGFFVALGGAFVLAQAWFGKRWQLAKYVWPASFFLSGMFVLVWSDTELWPFGHEQWLTALQNNREVLQHKAFAVLLLCLATIESLRIRGSVKAVWSGFVFPVLAIAGSILLLFHEHDGGAHDVEVMARIQSQHLSFAATGIGIGISKGLAEVRGRGQRVFGSLWPSLMVALGVLLMLYRE